MWSDVGDGGRKKERKEKEWRVPEEESGGIMKEW